MRQFEILSILFSSFFLLSCGDSGTTGQDQASDFPFQVSEKFRLKNYFCGNYSKLAGEQNRLLGHFSGRKKFKEDWKEEIHRIDLLSLESGKLSLPAGHHLISIGEISQGRFSMATFKNQQAWLLQHDAGGFSEMLLKHGHYKDPIYNKAGGVKGYIQRNGEPLEGEVLSNGFSSIRVHLGRDGIYYLLVANVTGELQLFGFSAAGELMTRQLVIPRIEKALASDRFNGPGVVIQDVNRNLWVATEISDEELQAYQVHSGQTLSWQIPQSSKRSYSTLLIQFDPSGKRVSSRLMPTKHTNFLADFASNGNSLAIAGSIHDGGLNRFFVYKLKLERTETQFYKEFDLDPAKESPRSLVVLDDGSVLVGGRTGFDQSSTGSVSGESQAFLLFLGNDLSQKALHQRGEGRSNCFSHLFLNENGNIYASAYLDAPTTHTSAPERYCTTAIFELSP